jgi:hypothetical protein
MAIPHHAQIQVTIAEVGAAVAAASPPITLNSRWRLKELFGEGAGI